MAETGHMFHGYSSAHIANIAVHILSGTVALLTGLLALLSAKGGWLHRRAGRWFVYAYVGITVTAVLGIVVFEFRSFLAVATIASAYGVFAGYRAIVLRGERPRVLDLSVAFVGVTAPGAFVAAMHWLHQPWSPVLTWSVLGGLLMNSTYDLCRTFLPAQWLRRVWVQEHLVKITGAYIAVCATFAGTVFPRWMPWSAVVPVSVGETVIAGFLIAGPRAWRRGRRLKEHPAPDEVAAMPHEELA